VNEWGRLEREYPIDPTFCVVESNKREEKKKQKKKKK